MTRVAITVAITVITFCQQINAVIWNFTEYTHVSKQFGDTPCIDGCSTINDCVIDWEWNKADCSAFGIAPIYHTTRKEDPQSKYCLSNCDYFGEKYEWCVTSEDIRWDYCSTYESTTKLPSGEIEAHTVYGKKCLSECHIRDDFDFYQCRTLDDHSDEAWELCAPPVLPRIPVLRSHFLKYTSLYSGTRAQCLTATDIDEYFITHLADAIEGSTVRSNDVTQVTKGSDSTVPIDGYAMVKINNMFVPAVIRAHVTNETIDGPPLVVSASMKRKLREQMAGTTNSYEAGWLMGAQIGGPSEMYNLVPKPRSLKCKEWWNMEVEVRNWCYSTGGAVDMTIVVFYVDQNTPVPHAFGVALSFTDEDNRFVERSEKIHFNYF